MVIASGAPFIRGIYSITNRVTGRTYVGQSVNIHSRWSQHLGSMRRGRPEAKYMAADLKEHGVGSFDFKILEEVTTDELTKKEQLWIDELGASDPDRGYNGPQRVWRQSKKDHREFNFWECMKAMRQAVEAWEEIRNTPADHPNYERKILKVGIDLKGAFHSMRLANPHNNQDTIEPESAPTREELVGKYFHTIEDGWVERQGRVIASVTNTSYFVQWYSWIDGEESNKTIVHLSEMVEGRWAFYDSSSEMDKAYQHEIGVRRRPIDLYSEWSSD